MNVNLRMSAGVSITVCVCAFQQPALQLFPFSYHTALKVAELCVCVSMCALKVTAAESFLSRFNSMSLPRRGEVEVGI